MKINERMIKKKTQNGVAFLRTPLQEPNSVHILCWKTCTRIVLNTQLSV